MFTLLGHLLLPFLEPSDCRRDVQPHHLFALSHGHLLHSGLPGGGFRAGGMVHTGYQQPELASQLSYLCVLSSFPSKRRASASERKEAKIERDGLVARSLRFTRFRACINNRATGRLHNHPAIRTLLHFSYMLRNFSSLQLRPA